MECKIGHNVGHGERVIRITLGITLLAFGGLTALPVWETVVTLVIGLVALVSGMMGFCPAWRVLGINTCDHNHAKDA